MKQIEEMWLADRQINIEDILSKKAALDHAIDDLLREDKSEKPTTHRVHREIARIYKEKLNKAINAKSLVVAEIIVQTMVDSYNPDEIMFWYDNPDFKEEKDGDYHHNKSGKEKIKKVRSYAEDLQASLGLYETRGYAKHPRKAEGIFKKIIRHICETDIEKHATAIKDFDTGEEYGRFISSVRNITNNIKKAVTNEGGLLHLRTALYEINDLHKKYNERYVGEKCHDICKKTRTAAERFLIDVGLLKTVITRYLDYKLGMMWLSNPNSISYL